MLLLKDGLHWFLVELYQAYFYSCWDDFWIFLLKDLIRIIIELFIYLTLITGKYVKTLILYIAYVDQNKMWQRVLFHNQAHLRVKNVKSVG